MLVRNSIIIIFIYTFSLFAQNTYLVDREGSGDFSTIAEVNKANLKNGDIVKFKSGQQFTDAILECQEGVLYTSSSFSKAIIGDPQKSSFKKTISIGEENVTIDNLKIYGYSTASKAVEYRRGGTTISNCEIVGGKSAHSSSAFGIDLYSNEILKNPVKITNNTITDFYKGIYLRNPYNIEISYNKISRMYKYDGMYGLGGDCIVGTNSSDYDGSFNTEYTLWIHHNELTEYEHTAIWIGNISAVLFEYNEVHSNLDDRIFFGGCKSGGLGKVWDNTGQVIGSLGHIIRYNYFHDIKRYGQPGYSYKRPTPEQAEEGKIIVYSSNNGLPSPLYIGANFGNDYKGEIGNLISGQGYGNYWIHNNVFYNIGLQILSKGRNYLKDNTSGSLATFKKDYRAYFVNNTLINTGFNSWITDVNGVIVSESTSQSPDFVVNNIIDFQSDKVRQAARYKEEGLYLDYNIYVNQSGTTNQLPSINDKYATYLQSTQNTASGRNEQYSTDPNWFGLTESYFVSDIGIKGVNIPDARLRSGGNASNKGMEYNLIGDTYTVLGLQHTLGSDPTGRSFAYDILGNYRETNDIGAVGTLGASDNPTPASQAPSITNQPGSSSIELGQDVTITIEATCDDEIGYQWWQSPYVDESSKITEGDKYLGSTSKSLTIKNVSEEDSKIQYVCEVYNTKDRSQLWTNSSPATIIIKTVDSPSENNQLIVYLEAPFKDGEMQTKLNTQNYIPNQQPYTSNPWQLSELENLVEIKPNYIDWLVVELRSNEQQIEYSKAAILTNQGLVLNPDGSKLSFKDIKSDQYYVAIKHRNHLGIMSSVKIEVNTDSPINYNFTDSQSKAFGKLPMAQLEDSKFAMFSGDADANGVVNNLDFGKIANNIPFKGYSNGDLDLNGVINVLDYYLINKNILKKSNIN